MTNRQGAQPYIPNTAPANRRRLMDALGISDPLELFREIPEHLKFHGELDLPAPMADEFTLRNHLEHQLDRNLHAGNCLNFMGAGCARHFVPAVCDEVAGRGEFLTAYASEFYADHGKWQALFEFSSLMAELLDMDVVSGFLYDGAQAVATSLRMAMRMTGRDEVLIPATLSPQVRQVVNNYLLGVAGPMATIREVGFDPASGLMDQSDLERQLSPATAAVLVENPSFLGFLETGAREIGALARRHGAEFVVSTDPISLGVLPPPARYGATIACGDYHPLGLHMNCGGGQAGFIATSGDMRYLSEYKDKMYGLAPTSRPGEFGFANILFDRTSFGSREKAREYTGTSNGLWAVVAGAYLALMGPTGMAEVGESILQKSHYAARKLAAIPGLAPALTAPFFKEFPIRFDGWGLTVAQVNAELLKLGIFGGVDLSRDFPFLGQSALYCVTETSTREDLDRLAACLEEIMPAAPVLRG